MRRKRRTLPISEHWQLVKRIWSDPMIASGRADDGTRIAFLRCQSCQALVTDHPSVQMKHTGSGHILSQPVYLSVWERILISWGLIPYVP